MTEVVINQNDGFVQITATGGETNLDFDFPIYEKAHVKIVRTRSGTDTALVLNTDYTIADGELAQTAGGTAVLTTPATASDIYTLLLCVPEERTTDFNEAGAFLASTVNRELDLFTQQTQGLRRDVNKSAKMAETSAISSITLPDPENGKVIGWNGTAGLTQNYSAADISATLVSSFMETLLDDADASTARATLSSAKSGTNSDITSLTGATSITGVTSLSATSITGVSTLSATSVTATSLSATSVTATSLAGVTSINGGEVSGRNFVQNGNFNIWQRATTYTLTTSSAYGSADRWAFYMSTTANGIANRDTSTPTGLGLRYSLKLGRDASGTETGQITASQTLETSDSLPMAGKTVTLSYYAKAGADYSSASSLLNVKLYYGTGTDEASPPTGFTGVTEAISETDTLTTSWQRFSHTVALSASATQVGLQFFYNGVGTAGADDNVYITGVQLEISSVATSLKTKPMSEEMEECYRYYQEVGHPSVGYVQAGLGLTISSSAGDGQYHFKPMRTLPTVTYSDVSHWRGTDGSVASAATALTFDLITQQSYRWNITGIGTPWTAASRPLALQGNNTTSARIYISAEL